MAISRQMLQQQQTSNMRTWINIAPTLEDWYLLERDTGIVIDTPTRSGKQFGRDTCDSDWWRMKFDSESADYGCAGCRENCELRVLRCFGASSHFFICIAVCSAVVSLFV